MFSIRWSKHVKKIRVLGYVPSTRSCNALLDALQLTDDVKLAWKFYAAAVRSGIIPDSFSWSLIVRLLCREGNLKSAVRLLNLGIYSAAIYNLIIDCYCKNGNFSTAVDLLSEMHSKNLTPGFGTYSSILDGACKFGDAGVIEMITRDMVARKLLPAVPSSNYDQIIQNLCSLGKIYAAEMFFDKARDEKIKLRDASCGCLLKAFSKDGRVKKAISMYSTISERGITVDRSSIFALADLICKEEPSEEVYKLLKDVVERGFNPCALDVSKIIGTLSNEGRWKEVEDLVTVLVEKGFIPDSFCCCSLVEHYCSDRRIDLAVTLHHKIEKLGRCFDVTTYNLLLNGLFVERRIEEATRVFDYMRQHNVVTTDSFSIMIRGLCHEKELRKAMVIHDEMLRMGLKPDKATYKRLISGFV
ncbi:PREDICTED: pentatricopeptide repeat-containing protein At4g21170 isoform X1 [Nelumbo nucifera]|uniref:Pentatricopeptide repeat-containing protein At4g21170 isoform X1 n=1 Tax=Nelumbo nucifera TaxID=4432 RepID=A0A1U8AKB9_NELNU|nr:PREDICTED: pentatricopeptide repeat-containing protein At4g21170 isoform X1 [Nelumbo nucifera]